MPTRREINSEEQQPEVLQILKLGTVTKCVYCCISGGSRNKKNWFYQLKSIYHSDFVTNSYVES